MEIQFVCSEEKADTVVHMYKIMMKESGFSLHVSEIEEWRTFFVKQARTGMAIIAECEGTMCGFICADRLSEYKVHSADYAYITDLFVLKSFRNQKIAVELVGKISEKLFESGYKKIYTRVLKNFEAPQRTFIRAGYKKTDCSFWPQSEYICFCLSSS